MAPNISTRIQKALLPTIIDVRSTHGELRTTGTETAWEIMENYRTSGVESERWRASVGEASTQSVRSSFNLPTFEYVPSHSAEFVLEFRSVLRTFH